MAKTQRLGWRGSAWRSSAWRSSAWRSRGSACMRSANARACRARSPTCQTAPGCPVPIKGRHLVLAKVAENEPTRVDDDHQSRRRCFSSRSRAKSRATRTRTNGQETAPAPLLRRARRAHDPVQSTPRAPAPAEFLHRLVVAGVNLHDSPLQHACVDGVSTSHVIRRDSTANALANSAWTCSKHRKRARRGIAHWSARQKASTIVSRLSRSKSAVCWPCGRASSCTARHTPVRRLALRTSARRTAAHLSLPFF